MTDEISCGFVLYQRTPTIQFLLLKLPRPEEWDFPKGHQHGSETFYETAERELREEAQLEPRTDVIVARTKGKPEQFSYEYRSPSGAWRKIVLFAGSCDKNPVLSSEHNGFAWVTFAEAKKLLKYPEVSKCLEQIHHFISNSKAEQISA